MVAGAKCSRWPVAGSPMASCYCASGQARLGRRRAGTESCCPSAAVHIPEIEIWLAEIPAAGVAVGVEATAPYGFLPPQAPRGRIRRAGWWRVRGPA